jgi:hypothetical protein
MSEEMNRRVAKDTNMITRLSSRAIGRRAFTRLQLLIMFAIIVALDCAGLYALPGLMYPGGTSRTTIAEVRVQQLTYAVEVYKHNNDTFPATLEALAKVQPNGGAPLVTADQLLDPWGEPYGYDPAGPKNDGLRPDIWVDRPDGSIGNWPNVKGRRGTR